MTTGAQKTDHEMYGTENEQYVCSDKSLWVKLAIRMQTTASPMSPCDWRIYDSGTLSVVLNSG